MRRPANKPVRGNLQLVQGRETQGTWWDLQESPQLLLSSTPIAGVPLPVFLTNDTESPGDPMLPRAMLRHV